MVKIMINWFGQKIQCIRECLTTNTSIGFSRFSKKIHFGIDASFDTIGAVLSQKDDSEEERVIAYG